LAFYTRGGLGSVFALFVTPMIRTWSRFVVSIGLFGLLAVGLWLTSLGHRRGRRALVVAATVVLVVGVLDQTSPTAAPQYAALQAQQTELTAYTRTLARAVGNCPVFQLPVVAFPEEPPPGAMDDYDHFLPTVTSPAGLTWSYAAIRGTARADWQFALPVVDQARLLDDLAAAGFCAVEIDHQGYAGSTDPGTATERLAGAPVATAPRSHLAAYNLRPVAARLAATAGSAAVTTLREEVLHPLFASMSGSLIDATTTEPFQWTGPQTTVTVSNLGSSTATAILTFTVWGNGAAPRTVRVHSPGVPDSVVTVSDSRPHPVSLEVAARPGTTDVTVSATRDPVAVAGSQGAMLASLKVADLRLAADSGAPAASLQQFASASPRSLR
ncbi:MAG TPA: hypothetical protein VGN19_08545, partial [Pedococcus sp.]|nr:hypothetical protein [Pedococcus sp.]